MKLPPPPPESKAPRIKTLDDLAPRFALRLTSALNNMKTAGWDPVIFETLRTDARQKYLYGFGRNYDDGRGRVTASRDGNESWHFYGLAADIISASKDWGAPPSFWTALGEHVRAIGLHWGGNWRRPDLPHVQWGEPMRDSPSPRAARLFTEGGRQAVWKEVGAA